VIPSDFARLTGRDLAFIGGVLVGLAVAGLTAWAGVLWAARVLVG